MTKATGRGGRRPGAGAPKGNKNRLTHGRYTGDPNLRAALAALTAPQRHALMPYIREGARSIKARTAWVSPSARRSDPKILPFHQPSITTTTQPLQSNPATDAGPLRHLALRLAAHGFMGAEAFIRAHSPAAPIIELVIDQLDAFDDTTYSHIANPGGLLRNAIHEEIADYTGPTPRCPYCRWQGGERKERTS